MSELKLHLGCGDTHREGYINVDISPKVNPDLVHDLNKPLPFKPNSIKEIVFRHGIEHIEHKRLFHVLKDWYKKSSNGATWNFIVPYGYKMSDTIHHYCMGWNHKSFNIYDINRNNRRDWYSNVTIKINKIEARNKKWDIRELIPYKVRYWLADTFTLCMWDEIEYVLEVVKEDKK